MAQESEMAASFSTTASPEAAGQFAAALASSPPARLYRRPSTEPLRIDDLIDFSNHDLFPPSSAETLKEHSSSAAGSCPVFYDQTISPSLSGFPSQPSTFDLYTPCEEAAELEWLSKFVDDSFNDFLPNYHTTCSALHTKPESRQLQQEQSIPAVRGARSKRSRVNAAAVALASALIPPPANHSSLSSFTSSSSSSDFLLPDRSGHNSNSSTSHRSNARANNGDGAKRRRGGGVGGEQAGNVGMEGGARRRCTHCVSEKTPQWRTGPLGPKTLCNACGVRYKSGRLVPEYRPAASPTFLLTQHSNSHRKVIELRRQKEILLLNNPTTAAATSTPATRPELLFNDHEYGVR